MQGMCRCESMLSLQDCSPFRKSADLSSQLCGNLCSATALLHVQPLGRMLSHRHVRAKSGEGCLLCLHDIGSASRMPVPPSTFHGGGVAVFLCSAQKAVSRLRCGLGGGDHLPSLPPLNTKGDDAADTEASELGSRASGFQKKQRRRPKGVDPPFWRVTPLTKGQSDLRVRSHGRTEDRAARYRTRLCSSHRGQSSPRSSCISTFLHYEAITRAERYTTWRLYYVMAGKTTARLRFLVRAAKSSPHCNMPSSASLAYG